MIYCVWCGEEIDSFLLHVCSDGSTFDDRSTRALNGEIPPYERAPKREKDDGYTELLAPSHDEILWLKAMRIRW